jgi:hypothetical protein
MNFVRHQVIVGGNQNTKNHPAKLPKQLRFKLSVHIERVNIHQQPPAIRMVPVFGQGESERICLGEMIFKLHPDEIGRVTG